MGGGGITKVLSQILFYACDLPTDYQMPMVNIADSARQIVCIAVYPCISSNTAVCTSTTMLYR